jgi:hypothetical protein
MGLSRRYPNIDALRPKVRVVAKLVSGALTHAKKGDASESSTSLRLRNLAKDPMQPTVPM